MKSLLKITKSDPRVKDAWSEARSGDGDVHAYVRGEVTEALLSGADDRWSGRTNDFKRTCHDGIITICKRLLSLAS